MGLGEIIGIISIIMLVSLITGIFFKKEYSRIEDRINQVKTEDSTIEENLFYIRLEIGKIRKIFYIFLLTIVIPLIIRVVLLTIALVELNQIIDKLKIAV